MKSRPPPILLPGECAKSNRKRSMLPKISKKIISKHAFVKPTPIKKSGGDESDGDLNSALFYGSTGGAGHGHGGAGL